MEPKDKDLDNNKKSGSIMQIRCYKTKVCHFYTQGKCNRGIDCLFAHCPAELADTPDLRKTKLCNAWAKGTCTHRNCCYAHGKEELRPQPPIRSNSPIIIQRNSKLSPKSLRTRSNNTQSEHPNETGNTQIPSFNHAIFTHINSSDSYSKGDTPLSSSSRQDTITSNGENKNPTHGKSQYNHYEIATEPNSPKYEYNTEHIHTFVDHMEHNDLNHDPLFANKTDWFFSAEHADRINLNRTTNKQDIVKKPFSIANGLHENWNSIDCPQTKSNADYNDWKLSNQPYAFDLNTHSNKLNEINQTAAPFNIENRHIFVPINSYETNLREQTNRDQDNKCYEKHWYETNNTFPYKGWDTAPQNDPQIDALNHKRGNGRFGSFSDPWGNDDKHHHMALKLPVTKSQSDKRSVLLIPNAKSNIDTLQTQPNKIIHDQRIFGLNIRINDHAPSSSSKLSNNSSLYDYIPSSIGYERTTTSSQSDPSSDLCVTSR